MQGQTDVPLNATGMEQARKIGRRLAEMELPPQYIMSSDLSRASATAECIASPLGLSVFTTPLFREMGLGEWEGLTQSDIEERGDADKYRKYRLSPDELRPPAGEHLKDASARMLQGLSLLREQIPSGQAVIVGHGGSLRALLCAALDAPVRSMVRFALSNASLTIIEETTTETSPLNRVLCVNDISHLL